MEISLIIAGILVLLGIVGSLAPALPGPILSFIALAILYFARGSEAISLAMLFFFGITMLLISALDYFVPLLGAKFSGASKKGQWGSIIGGLVGFIVAPPLGIFLGGLIGAVIGEMQNGKNFNFALRTGLGVFATSVAAIALQFMYALWVAIYFFIKVF